MNTFFEQEILQVLKKLYNQDIPFQSIQIQKTRKEFEGDITLVVFPLLKISSKTPELTAQEIGEKILENISQILSFNVVKGFLNLTIKDEYYVNQFSEIIHLPSFGRLPDTGKTIMVEYSSPNTNKPLHLGHIRNITLGYSVANILEASGNKVLRTQIINDRGVHICKSMLAWQKWGNGETPESSGMKGDHLVGKYYVLFGQENKIQAKKLHDQGVKEDEAENNTQLMFEVREMLVKWEEGQADVVKLWETMNGWVFRGFDVTYKTLGVHFDQLYYESNTYIEGKKIVEESLQKGVFFKKQDGSVWCDLTADGLDEKLLLRADGTSVYMTQDLGTAVLRFKDNPQTVQQIYTVGNEQDYHFKVLFLILQKLGYEWAKNNYHLSYGMMELPSGKMKTREGTVVDADDLMQEMHDTAKTITEELGKIDDVPNELRESLYWNIGLGALKYFILKVDPKKRMIFDPKESIDFNGHTGPFIQYTCARTSAIQRKAHELTTHQNNNIIESLHKEEKELIKCILEYPEKIAESAKEYSPAIIANYIYELARNYNHLYQTLSILREENLSKQYLRVQLSIKTSEILNKGLNLLGIQAPERM